jgi:glycosyltransferase involved in cell wall biosynthesis
MRELTALGYEVHVAVPHAGPLIQQYQNAGIHVHEVDLDFPVRQPWRWHTILEAMRSIVSDVQPDLIHSHFVSTTLTMRLALGERHHIPRIFQVPSPLHLEYLPFRKGELFTAGDQDYWIATCQWTYDCYIREGVRPDHVSLSYYGTDIEKFVVHSQGHLRSELGEDTKEKLIGMVAYMYAPKMYLGQMRGLKGHEDLIDAIEICLKTEPNLRGVFIGGAWNGAVNYERRVQRYGKEKCGDRVVFLGTRSDVPELYPDLDVVVHPSHHENVGGAAESLLLAVPTIATNVGGFPDVVKPGETGWLVPPNNPQQLAEAILEVLHDPYRSRKMALQGQALTRSLFDVKRTAREVSECYKKILG